MVYIISYQVGASDEIKLAQIEAESINDATIKVNRIFSELDTADRRKHMLVDIVRLSEIRKLDAFE